MFPTCAGETGRGAGVHPRPAVSLDDFRAMVRVEGWRGWWRRSGGRRRGRLASADRPGVDGCGYWQQAQAA